MFILSVVCAAAGVATSGTSAAKAATSRRIGGIVNLRTGPRGMPVKREGADSSSPVDRGQRTERRGQGAEDRSEEKHAVVRVRAAFLSSVLCPLSSDVK
jgi:hypothetical protein